MGKIGKNWKKAKKVEKRDNARTDRRTVDYDIDWFNFTYTIHNPFGTKGDNESSD